MPAFDANLMFRTTGNLTNSVSPTTLTVRGTGIKGMAVRVAVPTAFHDDDTLTAKVYVSDDASNFDLLAQSDNYATLNSNPRDIIVPVITDRKYVKLELVPTSTTAANINFGAVQAGLVVNVGYNYDRSLSFE